MTVFIEGGCTGAGFADPAVPYGCALRRSSTPELAFSHHHSTAMQLLTTSCVQLLCACMLRKPSWYRLCQTHVCMSPIFEDLSGESLRFTCTHTIICASKPFVCHQENLSLSSHPTENTVLTRSTLHTPLSHPQAAACSPLAGPSRAHAQSHPSPPETAAQEALTGGERARW
jgi:hypothetical protein